MTRKERAQLSIKALKELYPDVKCSLNYSTPLEMLLATQMSAQCTDAGVNRVTSTLFKKYTSAEDFANADLDELQNDIRSIGLYRNKSKNIIACCKKIIQCYDGQVPGTMEELLTLPGTGRKTANLILGEIFEKPAVVVDTHCMRLSKRIGLTSSDTPEKIEKDLQKLIPPDEQLDFCHRLVYHGRAICSSRNPKCSLCTLNEFCKSNTQKTGK